MSSLAKLHSKMLGFRFGTGDRYERAYYAWRRAQDYQSTGAALRRIDERIAAATRLQLRDQNTPRFSVLQDVLMRALKEVKPGYDSRKHAHDLFTHVFIEATSDESGYGDVTFNMYGYTATIKGKVDKPGRTVIHYKTLADLVKLLPRDRIDFTPAWGKYPDMPTAITLRCGMTRATFKSVLETDKPFPTRPHPTQLPKQAPGPAYASV